MLENILILLFFIILFFLLFNFAWAGISAAPWVPSKKKDFYRILELAEAKPGDVIYDLGCGDGRWLFYFAKNTQAKTITGFEISFSMLFICWIKKLFTRYPQVKIQYKNLYKVDLSSADIVLCFLMPKTIEKLLPKIKSEMKSGSKLISYAFSAPIIKPEKISKISQKDISIYLYRF